MNTLIVTFMAFLVLLACMFEPSGVAWQPPERYRIIWAEAEMCSGTYGDYDKVHWYLVPGHEFKCDTGYCIGEWKPPHSISIASDWEGIDWVVRHEMLHELTRFRHDGDDMGPGPRDIALWGIACHSTWGYLDDDPTYRP